MCHCKVYHASHSISRQAEDGLAVGVDVVGELFGHAVDGDGIEVVEPSGLAPTYQIINQYQFPAHFPSIYIVAAQSADISVTHPYVCDLLQWE